MAWGAVLEILCSTKLEMIINTSKQASRNLCDLARILYEITRAYDIWKINV